MILIQIAGHLGADPETRFTPSGQKVTNLRVATNIRRGGKEKTVWWRVTLWGDRFDRMLPYLKKGSAIFVMGTMNAPELYPDREGNTQVSLEITAEYIGFNPFGQKERQETAAGAESESSFAAAHAATAGAKSHSAPAGVVQGSGSDQHSSGFEEDDIPL